MLNTGIVLVTFHPLNGVQAFHFMDEEKAKEASFKFARENYSGIRTHDVHMISSWHLMEDDGTAFFGPKPWPIASMYYVDLVKDRVVKVDFENWHMPEVISYLANGPRFLEIGSPNLEDAKNRMLDIIVTYGGYAENNRAGGITYKWVNPEDEKIHIVGYSFELPKLE